MEQSDPYKGNEHPELEGAYIFGCILMIVAGVWTLFAPQFPAIALFLFIYGAFIAVVTLIINWWDHGSSGG